MMGFGMGFGGLGGLLVIALLVVGGVYLFRTNEDRSRDRTPTSTTHQDSALQLLRERYARGEIDREEYDRRKEGLS